MRALNIQNILLSYGFLIIFCLLLVFFSAATPHFFSVSNIVTVLASAAPWILMATGETLVIMTGNIDISVGAILFLSMVVGDTLMLQRGVSPWLAVPLMFVIGAGLGSINGFIINVLKINPLITTLGMLFALRGFSLYLTNEQMLDIPPAFHEIREASLLPGAGHRYFTGWADPDAHSGHTNSFWPASHGGRQWPGDRCPAGRSS